MELLLSAGFIQPACADLIMYNNLRKLKRA